MQAISPSQREHYRAMEPQVQKPNDTVKYESLYICREGMCEATRDGQRHLFGGPTNRY